MRTTKKVLRLVSFRNASALWVLAAILVVAAFWVPDQFFTSTTLKTLLNEESLTALAAVALIIPLASGVFDLAIGTEVGFGMIAVAWLLADKNVPVAFAIALAVGGGALIGLLSGLLVTKVKIDSFIATLGISSILTALISWISDGQQIVGLGSGFQSIAGTQIFGLTLPVYLMLALAIVVWYVLEQTPIGRRVYATGGNESAARLAGIRTNAVVVASFAGCGALASFAGVLLAARLGAGDPTVGPNYLLPTFSAVFLGATQFRNGRFNVWGTVVALYVLATGVKALQLGGAPFWIPSLFNGLALLVAVALTKYGRPKPTAEKPADKTDSAAADGGRPEVAEPAA
jgi:ribose transport system permease protein